jgi:hypothetical protein
MKHLEQSPNKHQEKAWRYLRRPLLMGGLALTGLISGSPLSAEASAKSPTHLEASNGHGRINPEKLKAFQTEISPEVSDRQVDAAVGVIRYTLNPDGSAIPDSGTEIATGTLVTIPEHQGVYVLMANHSLVADSQAVEGNIRDVDPQRQAKDVYNPTSPKYLFGVSSLAMPYADRIDHMQYVLDGEMVGTRGNDTAVGHLKPNKQEPKFAKYAAKPMAYRYARLPKQGSKVSVVAAPESNEGKPVSTTSAVYLGETSFISWDTSTAASPDGRSAVVRVGVVMLKAATPAENPFSLGGSGASVVFADGSFLGTNTYNGDIGYGKEHSLYQKEETQGNILWNKQLRARISKELNIVIPAEYNVIALISRPGPLGPIADAYQQYEPRTDSSSDVMVTPTGPNAPTAQPPVSP